MNAENKVTIKSINCKPELDPYHTDTNGISYTLLRLFENGNITVSQEYKDNATPSDEWHYRTLAMHVPQHPLDTQMQQWLNDNLALFQEVYNGFSIMWDGSNFVGKLTDTAYKAWLDIQCILEKETFEHYAFWNAEDWLQYYDELEITANATNQEIETMTLAIISDGIDQDIILDKSDIIEYLEQLRQNDRI